jgi:hypothetical protein
MPIQANLVHAGSPDLMVESVWIESAANPGQAVTQVALGDQFNIVASVRNIGDAPAFGYYLDVYYDNDYGRGGPDDITASEVQTWFVGPLTAEAGSHTTRWVVDPDNQIAEQNESNSEQTYTFNFESSTVTTTTTSTIDEYSVAVLAKTLDGVALSGVQIGFSGQVTMTDASGSVQFSATSGTYNLSAQPSVNVAPGVQYVFAQWSDGDSISTKTIALSESTTYCATYKTQYQLTMSVSPSSAGSTSPAVGSSWYDSGQTVNIQASPAAGYSFGSWAGSGSGSYTGAANPASVVMNGPINETATLTKPTVAAISGVAIAPNPVLQGSAVSFTISVRNLGKTALSSLKVQVTSYAPDGSVAGSSLGTIGKVAGGAVGTVKIPYTLPQSAPVGPWGCRVSVYSGDSLLDQKADGSFTVNQAIISGSIISVSRSANRVARGGAIGFKVTIKNTGNIAWSKASISVKIYGPDGTLVATPVLTTGIIKPNSQNSYTISWRVPSGAARGVWRYEVYVNYGSVLISSNTDAANTFTVT